MNSIHTTDQLAVARTEIAARQDRAARRRSHRPEPGTTLEANVIRVALAALATVTIALTGVGGDAAAAEVVETATSSQDSYELGDKILPGHVDGWFLPGADDGDSFTYDRGRVR